MEVQMLETTWNTGRKYTANGQVMRAKQDGNTILFADDSRMVDGEMEITESQRKIIMRGSMTYFKEYVMGRYDRGEYKCSHESWCYLMVKGA
jgi:hypothetical protein